jgi:hypothetical protein
MDESLFTLDEEGLWDDRVEVKEKLLEQEFTLGEEDFSTDAEAGLFDEEESLW